jgi:phenylalanyl-tRNA synthetase beta chain
MSLTRPRCRAPCASTRRRAARTLLALDGKTYALRPGRWRFPTTAGRNRWPASWGATFGLHRGHTDVFLESAYWDPITIAATGRALRINSDARYRFERGVDPAFTLPGLELATQMILDLCGGQASDRGRGRCCARHDPRLPL